MGGMIVAAQTERQPKRPKSWRWGETSRRQDNALTSQHAGMLVDCSLTLSGDGGRLENEGLRKLALAD